MSLNDETIQTYIFKIDGISSNESLIYDQDENKIGKLTGLKTKIKKLYDNKDSLIFQIKKKKKSVISTSTTWEIENNAREMIGVVKRNPFNTGAPDHIQLEDKDGRVLDTFIPSDEYFSEKIEDKNGKKIAEFYLKNSKKMFRNYNNEYRLHVIDSSFERITLLALIIAILGEKHSFYVHHGYGGESLPTEIDLIDDRKSFFKL